MLPWNMTYYQEKIPGATRVSYNGNETPPEILPEEKKRLEDFFDKANIGQVDNPCIVVDIFGRVVVWYMPDIIHPARVV